MRLNLIKNIYIMRTCYWALTTAIIFVSSCTGAFNYDVKGKKLYYLESNERIKTFRGINYDLISVTEAELDFKSDSEVIITPTAYYGIASITMPKRIKPRTYNYHYENDRLEIEGWSFNQKIRRSSDFYVDEEGDLLYDTSILTLSKEQKKERLNKLINDPEKSGKLIEEELVFDGE